MQFVRRWWLAALVPVAVASLILLTAQADGSQASHSPHSGVPAVHVTSAPMPVTQPLDAPLGLLTQYVQAVTTANVAEYVHDVQMANVATYVNAIQQANDIVAAEQAHTNDVMQHAAASPHYSGNVGDCTGFSIPDYIIQRESGGNPNAVNPSSGAYGCSQTLPDHYWPGGACAGIDMYSVDGQRQCTNILSNGGTNLAPWALTR